MTKYDTLLDTVNLCLYAKPFEVNSFDCIKIEMATSGKYYYSSFTVNMDNYKDKELLDVLQYYHITKFDDLEIVEYQTLEQAKYGMESILN